MKVIIVKPGQTAIAANVENELEPLQKIVGGFIECVYPFKDKVAIVCNEEGKNLNLPLNRALYSEDGGEIVDILFGNFIVCGTGKGDFTDLTEEQMEKYMKMFRTPEMFTVHVVNGRRVLQVDKVLGF